MRILRATKITFLVLALMVSASTALAGEFSAVLNGRSIHLGASEDWNENNLGLGVEYEFASESRWRKRLMANGFEDSNEDMSYMVGGGLHRNLFATDRLRGFYIDAGLNAFVMTREDVDDGSPFPGILPTLTMGNRYVGLNLTYLPKQAVEKFTDARMQDQSTSGIVFLQFKFSMNP
jgi:hypothetical protein